MAVNRLSPFGQHARLIRMSSRDAAEAITSSLDKFYWTKKYDVVYIDGRHAYESVAEDLALWWPVVRPGGILAGHDWHDASGDNAGVQRAVLEFADANNLTVYYTWDDNPQSWYVYKDAAPILNNRGPQ